MEKWCFKHVPQKLVRLQVSTAERQISITCNQFIPSQTSVLAHLGICKIDNQPCRGPVTSYASTNDNPIGLWSQSKDLEVVD